MTLAERLSQKELLTFDEIAELCYSEAENRACFLTDVLPIRDQSVTAAYVSYAATVFLNMENLEKDSKRMADSFISRKNFKAENEILYRNFYIFTTIFHEIEHACDYYKSFSSQFDEFEEWIYITSGRIRKIKELYEKHAFYFPRERNAEINAWIKALNVFSHTDLTKEELMELQRWIISFVVFGYDQKEGGLYTGPFESLLKKYSLEEYNSKKDDIKNSISTVPTFKRSLLGLPLLIREVDYYLGLSKKEEVLDLDQVLVKVK